MRYFQKFPTLNYRTTEIQNGLPQEIFRTVPNMTVRLQSVLNLGGYEWYKIQDRDRPDLLAAQWYDSSEYAWVVMLSNNMRDLYDWPMTNLEFHDYMAKKYQTYDENGVGQNNGVEQSQITIHQYLWINSDTGQELVVDEIFYAALSSYERRQMSVYNYEEQLNDKRRDIKRLFPDTFRLLLQQFQELTGGM